MDKWFEIIDEVEKYVKLRFKVFTVKFDDFSPTKYYIKNSVGNNVNKSIKSVSVDPNTGELYKIIMVNKQFLHDITIAQEKHFKSIKNEEIKNNNPMYIIELPVIRMGSTIYFMNIETGNNVILSREGIISEESRDFVLTKDKNFVKYYITDEGLFLYWTKIKKYKGYIDTSNGNSKNINTVVNEYLLKQLLDKGYSGKCKVRILHKSINKKKTSTKRTLGLDTNKRKSTNKAFLDLSGLYNDNNGDLTIIFRNEEKKKIYCYYLDKNSDGSSYPSFSSFSKFNKLTSMTGIPVKLIDVSDQTIELNVTENSDVTKTKALLNNYCKNKTIFNIKEISELNNSIILESDKGKVVIVNYKDIQITLDSIKGYKPRKIKSFIPKCSLKCTKNTNNRKLKKGDIYIFEKLKDRRNSNYKNSDIIIVKDNKGNSITTRRSNFKVV